MKDYIVLADVSFTQTHGEVFELNGNVSAAASAGHGHIASAFGVTCEFSFTGVKVIHAEETRTAFENVIALDNND